MYKGQKLIKTIKGKIVSDSRNFFEQEQEEENYYKPGKKINFIAMIVLYMKVGAIKIKLSIEEYLYKIRPNSKGIVNDLKKES